MIVRAAPLRPVEQALAFGDRQVVDAGVARLHQSVLIKLPVLIAERNQLPLSSHHS